MAEGTLRSYDPMRYFVNNLSEFDEDIVKAHVNKDSEQIRKILRDGAPTDFDVFICVNKNWHAFVLCAANKVDSNDLLNDMFSKDPFDIPGLLLVNEFELRFEDEQLCTYKIGKSMDLFKNIEHKIKKSYFIGNYVNVHPKAFQFAAMRSAPHRYNIMLNDCVEFSKEFCVQLLDYCSNYRDLEEGVHTRINKATATGLSAEQLSRRIRSSAWAVNSFLGGGEVTSYLTSGQGPTLFMVVFVLVYPVVVACLVSYLTVYFMK